MPYFYFWGFLLIMIIYFIVSDPEIGQLVYMFGRLLDINFQKYKWMLLNDPRNPIVKWMIWRKSMKMAEKIRKEIENK